MCVESLQFNFDQMPRSLPRYVQSPSEDDSEILQSVATCRPCLQRNALRWKAAYGNKGVGIAFVLSCITNASWVISGYLSHCDSLFLLHFITSQRGVIQRHATCLNPPPVSRSPGDSNSRPAPPPAWQVNDAIQAECEP